MTPRRGLIGVDLGIHTVKLAQVERVGDALRLREALIIRRTTPWSSSNWEAGILSSTDEIRAGLTLGRNFSGRQAACSASMRLCDLRMLEIASGTEYERRMSIAREFETLQPGHLSEREFDFWDAELPGELEGPVTNKTSVGVISMARNCATRIARDLSRSGVRCMALSCIPLALARAVQMASPDRDMKMVAALDLGAASTTFCVVCRGCPLYVRSFRGCHIQRVVDKLRQSLDISQEEAHLVLKDFGLPSTSDHSISIDDIKAVIAEAAAEPLQVLIDELNRTLLYLRTHRRALVPSEIVLLGGGASVRGISELLSHKTGLAVKLWRPERMTVPIDTVAEYPSEMLGPAIALSTHAWVSK